MEPARIEMDGIINYHKPVGITSAKALYRVRSITRMKKSGHAGTLDPGASGVLVLCLGKATKLVEHIMGQPKVYRATARLDGTSESFDSDRPIKPVAVSDVPIREAVAEAFRAFEGTIEQVPPAISAVKIAGQPAYKRNRSGVACELAARPVHIYWTCVHGYRWPEVDFELCCGRGMYVRALIRDVGARLGTGGCLTSLVRSRVGPFSLHEAWTEEGLRQSRPREYLIPLDVARTLAESQAGPLPPCPSPGV